MGGRGGNSGLSGRKITTPDQAMNALHDYSNLKSDGMFSRWQKYGKDRLYVNIEKLYNMEIEMYGSGNISYATVDGKKISNSLAKDILNENIYIGMQSGKVHSNRYGGIKEETRERLEKYIPKKIRKFIAF